MSKLNIKIALIALISIITIVVLSLGAYLIILPNFVKSAYVNNLVSKAAKDALGLELELKNPKLVTKINPEINFSIDYLLLKKNENILLNLKDFDIGLNFKNILSKKIKLNYLSADTLTLYADKLIEALPEFKEQEEQQPLDWKIDLYNSKLSLNKLDLSYKLNKSNILLNMDNVKITQNADCKTLDFNSKINVSKGNKNYLNIIMTAKDDIKLSPDKFETQDLEIALNGSKLKITSTLDTKKLTLNAKSDKFLLEDVFKIINSDIVIPDGEVLLAPLSSPEGQISYNVTMVSDIVAPFKNELNGTIFVNNTRAKIKDLAMLPLNVQKGKLVLSKDKVDFVDLTGYYGKNKKNGFKIEGEIKDYYKSMDSLITINTKVTNEFFKDYLSKLIGNTVLYTSEPFGTRIIYKSKYNIMDITWLAKIAKGINFGVNDSKSALSDYDRAVKGDFHIENNKLAIKNINYYIAPDIRRGAQIKPIITMDGDMDLAGNINRIGFFFAREMPCELLNIFTKEQTFKKGTIKGRLHVAFKNKTPVLDADMTIKDTRIPSQRTRIKEARLVTNNNYIMTRVIGRFRRSDFELKGNMANVLNPPFDIKNLILEVDKVDVEKLLASLSAQEQNTTNSKTQTTAKEDNDDDDDTAEPIAFTPNMVKIEHGRFKLNEGTYKDLKFGNIDSDISLDTKGMLKIQSNKFNIAEGISTLKVICDLAKLEYYIRLGAKEVDSNLMAKVLLNLDKEISGKASGLVELNSDASMKMNGQIKFEVKDGTIGKIGLVEYVLKIASVFRNPVVMISPQTIMDIVNIPEGKFERIYGEMKIKDNVVRNINIQSSSSMLSALIRGRFDMERHDASLRIYTRFSTAKSSTFGFLRNISLNALANKVQMNTRNDANYYSSELKDLPEIDIDNSRAQIFLTQVEGDVEHNNFLSTLKKIK